MNYAVVLAPDFALQAVLRNDPALFGKPVALAEGEGRKAQLSQVSVEAFTVAPGLAVALAMARCPGLLIRPRDPTAESEANRVLLAAAFTLSPRVEATSDGCCTVDLQGAEAGPTEERMHEAVAELAASGLRVRIGAGATPLLATYAAHRGEPVLVVRAATDFLAPLSIDAAQPTPTQAAVLHGWGIKTLGQFTALPKAEIARRLGTEGVALWERATGETMRVLRHVEPVKTFAAEWVYDPPVESLEPLLFRLRRYAERVALELRGAGYVAEQLTLTLFLEDETDQGRDFRLPEPSANLDGWMRILQAHLDTVQTAARVIGVRLTAKHARPPLKQDGLFDIGLRDPAAFWENLARMGAIVGDHCVGTPTVLDSWQPDSVVLEKPAESVPAPEPEPMHPPRGLTLRRFRPPWPARLAFLENRPVTVDADHTRHEVLAARGPFRSSGSWWDPTKNWMMDVWHIEVSSGAVYQVVQTPQGWCVEGVLD